MEEPEQPKPRKSRAEYMREYRARQARAKAGLEPRPEPEAKPKDKRRPPPPPKGNPRAKGNRGDGRPSLYKPQYAAIAKRMCEQGATNSNLADRFGVSISTMGCGRDNSLTFSNPARLASKRPTPASSVLSTKGRLGTVSTARRFFSSRAA